MSVDELLPTFTIAWRFAKDNTHLIKSLWLRIRFRPDSSQNRWSLQNGKWHRHARTSAQ
jgi:hypothetical protein